MSAAIAVQRALVAALAPIGPPVFDGSPTAAPLPRIMISDGFSVDWSTKTAKGREHRVSLAIWDSGDVPVRLHALIGAVEEAIEAVPRELPGHRIASVVLMRSGIVRTADGPWAGRLDYRVRTLAVG